MSLFIRIHYPLLQPSPTLYPLIPLGNIVSWCFRCLKRFPMMPRDANLSECCTPDGCSFSSMATINFDNCTLANIVLWILSIWRIARAIGLIGAPLTPRSNMNYKFKFLTHRKSMLVKLGPILGAPLTSYF